MADETEEETGTTEEETAEETEVSSDGLCMYIGPSITGVIQRSTIYQGSAAYALENDAALKLAVSKFELIAELVVDVDGDSLIDGMKEARTKGTDLFKAYKKLRKTAAV